jgi:hypothetical protein
MPRKRQLDRTITPLKGLGGRMRQRGGDLKP